ncbi:MAG: hypothetical protein AAGJ82_10200 [Bacteroidota bacterium]
MSFFERWFGNRDEEWVQPDIRFGRYSDSYKPSSCYDAWDEAVTQFEKGRFLDAYEQFLRFLRDDAEDNVVWHRNNQGALSFEFFQGSKRVVGWATHRQVRLEARVARMNEPRPELLRRLVEQNFSLKFSRYALDPDQHIVVVFDSETSDASPYKLYYAFKEVATHADKQDDLLLEEFGQIEQVDSAHLESLPAVERDVKHHFITNSISTTLQEALFGSLDRDTYPTGTSYLLFDLIYKLDYLTKPEGFTMESLERIHRRFFTKEPTLTAQQKNEYVIQELEQLLQRSAQDYQQEMYQVKTTFGITAPVTHDRIVGLIDAELHQMEWYQANNHPAVASAIPGYIIGYCLFNYAVPQPVRELFHLYYRVVQCDYFEALGFQPKFCNEDGHPNSRLVRKSIDKVVKKYRHRYPSLRPSVSSLVFTGKTAFAKSLLLMVRGLDLTRLD